MKINTYFIQLSITLLIIFGVPFIIKYFRTGEIYLDLLIFGTIGLILLITSLIWRNKK